MKNAILACIVAIVAMCMTSCVATQGQLDQLTSHVGAVEQDVGRFNQAVTSLVDAYQDVDSTLQDRATALNNVTSQLTALTTSVDHVADTAEKLGQAAQHDGGALIGAIGDLPVEGQLGLASGLAVIATNFLRDKKRKKRGEPVGTDQPRATA